MTTFGSLLAASVAALTGLALVVFLLTRVVRRAQALLDASSDLLTTWGEFRRRLHGSRATAPARASLQPSDDDADVASTSPLR